MSEPHLSLESTPTTPRVDLNPETGILSLTGVSIPENVIEFYAPILNWIKNYTAKTSQKITLILNLDYFNTGTSKILLELLSILKKVHTLENPIEIQWVYMQNDEDSVEAAEDYSRLLKIPIKLIPRT